MLDESVTALAQYCSLRVERDLDTIILRLGGEFDLACEERFNSELQAALCDPARWLVLDLRGLDFMDSTGLRVLVQVDAHARSADFQLMVLCGDGHVRHVLRESGLDGMLPVLDYYGPVPASNSPV